MEDKTGAEKKGYGEGIARKTALFLAKIEFLLIFKNIFIEE